MRSPLVLHFGYFDRPALVEGRLIPRRDAGLIRLAAVFRDLFGDLPGRGSPCRGFYDHGGLLTWARPAEEWSSCVPVITIVELVRRTGCEVVYASPAECRLVDPAELASYLAS